MVEGSDPILKRMGFELCQFFYREAKKSREPKFHAETEIGAAAALQYLAGPKTITHERMLFPTAIELVRAAEPCYSLPRLKALMEHRYISRNGRLRAFYKIASAARTTADAVPTIAATNGTYHGDEQFAQRRSSIGRRRRNVRLCDEFSPANNQKARCSYRIIN